MAAPAFVGLSGSSGSSGSAPRSSGGAVLPPYTLLGRLGGDFVIKQLDRKGSRPSFVAESSLAVGSGDATIWVKLTCWINGVETLEAAALAPMAVALLAYNKGDLVEFTGIIEPHAWLANDENGNQVIRKQLRLKLLSGRRVTGGTASAGSFE